MVEEYEERNKHLSCAPANEVRQRAIYRTLDQLEHFEPKPGQAVYDAKVERMRLRKHLSLPALAQFKLLHQQVLRKRRHLVTAEQKRRHDFNLSFHRSEKLPPIAGVTREPKTTESGVWSRYGMSTREGLLRNRKKLETQKLHKNSSDSGESGSHSHNSSRS